MLIPDNLFTKLFAINRLHFQATPNVFDLFILQFSKGGRGAPGKAGQSAERNRRSPPL
jgi:hypothetical protein